MYRDYVMVPNTVLIVSMSFELARDIDRSLYEDLLALLVGVPTQAEPWILETDWEASDPSREKSFWLQVAWNSILLLYW